MKKNEKIFNIYVWHYSMIFNRIIFFILLKKGIFKFFKIFNFFIDNFKF